MAEMIEGWEETLDEERRQKLHWMHTHKATVYVVAAPEDVLHDLPPELVLEVLIDRHGMLKLRGSQADLPTMVDRAYDTVKNLFDYVRDK